MPSRFPGTSAPTVVPLFSFTPLQPPGPPGVPQVQAGGSLLQSLCSSLWMKLASTRQQSTKEIEVVLLRILEYEKHRNLNILENKNSSITKGSFSSDCRPVGKTLKELKQWIFQKDTNSYMCNRVLESRDRNPCLEYHAWQRRQRTSWFRGPLVAGLCGNST